jgi:hypothetical protein
MGGAIEIGADGGISGTAGSAMAEVPASSNAAKVMKARMF